MKDIIPGLGETQTRKVLDKVFSRGMLGSVLLGASAGKIVEKFLNLAFNSTISLLVGWVISFVVFLLLFVYWDRIERAAKDAAEG